MAAGSPVPSAANHASSHDFVAAKLVPVTSILTGGKGPCDREDEIMLHPMACNDQGQGGMKEGQVQCLRDHLNADGVLECLVLNNPESHYVVLSA